MCLEFFTQRHSLLENIKIQSKELYRRPIRLTQCCTQFKSPGVKILCVLYLHHNVHSRLSDMKIPETKRFILKGFELDKTMI